MLYFWSSESADALSRLDVVIADTQLLEISELDIPYAFKDCIAFQIIYVNNTSTHL